MGFEHLRVGQVDYGYYGNHTSTIDWCEENYTHTPYVAEFYNAFTNFPTVALGIYGAYAALQGGLKKRYALAYLGLVCIGLGSFGFHATLTWEWQLMDELPMIYLVSYCGYLSIDTLPGFKPRFGILGHIILISWDIFVTLSYFYLPNPIYHQLAFGGILLSGVTLNFVFINRLSAAPDAIPERNEKVNRTLLAGIATFVLGFIIWNIDNFFCDGLRKGREMLGPLGFILQGHGYWHLLTGYGSFLIMTASSYLQLAIKTSPDAYDFDASSWFPVCYKVPSTSTLISRDEKAIPAQTTPLGTGKGLLVSAHVVMDERGSESDGSDISAGTRYRLGRKREKEILAAPGHEGMRG